MVKEPLRIPETSATEEKSNLCGCNDECDKARDETHHAKNVLNKHNTYENKIELNRCKAIFRKTVLKIQRNS